MLIEDMVLDLGFDVVGPALRLEKAFELVESETVDAAILDVNLGNCRSYPLAEMLSARGVPFAFATGYGSPGLEWADDAPLIRKPFQRDAVRDVLAGLFGNSAGDD